MVVGVGGRQAAGLGEDVVVLAQEGVEERTLRVLSEGAEVRMSVRGELSTFHTMWRPPC